MGGPGSGRKRGPRGKYKPRATSHDGLVFQWCEDAWAQVSGQHWPNGKYSEKTLGPDCISRFVEEVLGETPLPHQKDILRAVLTNDKVCVRSGQKTGKTKLVVWIALWVFCTFEGAEILMTATTKPQVKGVLWKQLSDTIRFARQNKGFQIEDPGASPETGLKSEDGRVIRGVTVREVEALSGVSGPHMWFIIDEASSLEQKKYEAIEGNTIGGAHIVMISNPTRTEGPFFDAFHHPTQKIFWKQFHLNSEDIAKWCDENNVKVPGVATLRKIEEWKVSYTVDHAFFIMRVKGDFVMNEQGKIISLDLIAKAQAAWVGHGHEGRLRIGVDPAGPGHGGDKWGFAVKRGNEIRHVYTRLGLTEEAGLVELRGLIDEYSASDENEIPQVVIDSEGPIGNAFYAKCKAVGDLLLQRDRRKGWETYAVKASSPATREPNLYERKREELWANCAKWLRDGGSIPPDDAELETELHAPDWEGTMGAKLKVTPKDILREKLDRSPDKADAVTLAIWSPAPWLDEREGVAVEPPKNHQSQQTYSRPGVAPMGEMMPGGSNPYDLLVGIQGGSGRRG